MYIEVVAVCRFSDEGACVVLWDLNTEGNRAVEEEIKAKGKKAHAYTCDCSKKEDIYRVAEEVGNVMAVTTKVQNPQHIDTKFA